MRVVLTGDALDGNEIELDITTQDDQQGWCRTADGTLHSFYSTWIGNTLQMWLDGNIFIFEKVESSRQVISQSSGGGGDIVAPMPGRVGQILV